VLIRAANEILLPLALVPLLTRMPWSRRLAWSGACVVAAHQFLSLHGECGYVDADGRPNADYLSAD